MNYTHFKMLDKVPHLTHGFTQRQGSGIELPFGNQHMGILSALHREEAWENVKQLAWTLNPKIKHIVATEQIHGSHLALFKRSESQAIEKDGFLLEVLSGTDGVFTQEKDVLLLTFYADCTPLFFYDPVSQAMGMAHSGWKGTAAGIGAKSVSMMESAFSSSKENILAVVAPSAGGCCYEVDDHVRNHFPKYYSFFKEVSQGHYLMDLKGINERILLEAGLRRENVEVSTECTLHLKDKYFSYRQEKGYTGRMAAFMILNSEGF